MRAKRELAGLLGTEPYAESDDEFVQMVSVRLPECEPEDVHARLFREERIEVVCDTWRGEPFTRICFQGYNDEHDLEALLEALPRVLR